MVKTSGRAGWRKWKGRELMGDINPAKQGIIYAWFGPCAGFKVRQKKQYTDSRSPYGFQIPYLTYNIWR